MTKWMVIWLMAVSSTVYGQRVFDVRKFGALGDGSSNDAPAIQTAIDSCSLTGGGIVVVPAPYTFISGPLELKSNVNLCVEPGAVLKASADESLYTKSAFRENRGEGTMWIWGENIDSVSISGSGIIDGNGIAFMGAERSDSYELKPFSERDPRPHVLTIIGGNDISIQDIHIGNAAYWTIHLAGCNNVVVSGITLLNSVKVRNSDGIDVDHSKRVRILRCHIESGDDCICLKNRREYAEFGACEHITVSNCTMTSSSCAIKIGSENMDTIRWVTFSHCIITNSNRGLGIQNRDEGVVSDITFSDISIDSHLFSDVWWGKAEPIYVTAYRRATANNKDANWRFPKGASEGKVGEVKNIGFSHITCTGENGVYVSGESADKVRQLVFEDVHITIKRITGLPGGIYDRRPSAAAGFVKGNTSGFYLSRATNITIRKSSVRWGRQLPAYCKYAIDSRAVTGLQIVAFTGCSAFPRRYEAIKK